MKFKAKPVQPLQSAVLALLLASAPPCPCNGNHTVTNRTHGCPGYSVFVQLRHLHLHHCHVIIIAMETEKPTTAVTH